MTTIEPVRTSEPTPPPFGTAKPAPDGPIPRSIDPLYRATKGTKRFKIRGPEQSFEMRYVLAKNQDEAVKHYCSEFADAMPKNAPKLDPNSLVIKELAD